MASIRRECRATSPTFDAMLQEAIALKETNDCAVRAVAIASGRSYGEAHAMLKALGRKDRQGTYRHHTRAALIAFGCIIRERLAAEFIVQYTGAHRRLHNVTTHHPQRFPKVWRNGRTYVLFTSGHVLTVVNGTNHDWTKGTAKRVVAIWEVTQ